MDFTPEALLRVGFGFVFFFAGDRDAQRAEEAQIVLRKGIFVAAVANGDFDRFGLAFGHIVEGDGGFKHEQHIEAVLADILHNARDLVVLGDRLMDGFAQLLDEFAQTSCHEHLHGLRPVWEKAWAAAWDLSTILPSRFGSKCETAQMDKKPPRNCRCYHHMGMKPQTIGRALGIGLRVAGKIAGQSLAAAAQPSSAAPAGQAVAGAEESKPAVNQASVRAASQTAGRTTKGVARGVGGFLRPFRRVGGIVWLEVTGSFFFLFVLVAGLYMWNNRPGHLNGPYDKNFFAAAVIVVVFFYLGASSFWRARRR